MEINRNNVLKENDISLEEIDIESLQERVENRIWINMNYVHSRFDHEFKIVLQRMLKDCNCLETIEFKLYKHFLEKHFSGRVDFVLMLKEA